MMPAPVARWVSMMVIGGIGAALFFSQGLHIWAGLIAWAALLDAGGDKAGLLGTIAGNTLGVAVGCAAEIAVFSIPVDPNGWHWIPRSAGAIALSLPVLVLSTRLSIFSHLPSLLYGFAAVFAAILIPYGQLSGLERLTGPHLSNPLIVLIISMAGGAMLGWLAERLAVTLSTSRKGRDASLGG